MATTYRSRTTVTNHHPFALRALVLCDGEPVSDDERRVSLVLRYLEGLAELVPQGEEVTIAKDGPRVGEGDGEGGRRMVRWSKGVDGKGGKKEGLFEWVVEIGTGEEVTNSRSKQSRTSRPPVSLKSVESA